MFQQLSQNDQRAFQDKEKCLCVVLAAESGPDLVVSETGAVVPGLS